MAGVPFEQRERKINIYLSGMCLFLHDLKIRLPSHHPEQALTYFTTWNYPA